MAPEDSTPGRLLRIVASIAPPLLSAARARDLSNLAWAFATLDLRKFDSVLMAIAREAVVQIQDFTEQNLSNTCWAFVPWVMGAMGYVSQRMDGENRPSKFSKLSMDEKMF
eukprot:s737_g26.t1